MATPAKFPKLKGWTTASDAANRLGVTRQRLNRMIHAGQFKSVHRANEDPDERPIFVIKTSEVEEHASARERRTEERIEASVSRALADDAKQAYTEAIREQHESAQEKAQATQAAAQAYADSQVVDPWPDDDEGYSGPSVLGDWEKED